MPCTWVASAGISTPGLTSHFRCFLSWPGVMSQQAAVTMRASFGLVPVVSVSKLASGPLCQPVACCWLVTEVLSAGGLARVPRDGTALEVLGGAVGSRGG